MSTDTLQKLVCRDAVATGELLEMLASHNPLVKQLTADYVAFTHRYSGHEDLSLLATNLLSRDCRDPNPVVACSAVTALAALHTSQDEALAAILHTFDSPHPRVRRCGVAACLPYCSANPDTAVSCGLTDRLYGLLRDPDPLVVSHSLTVLEEVLQQEGGVVINRAIAQYLFSRISQFSDSSLETVLNFLKKYTPKDDKEMFELLNPLDGCFKTDNAAVLVAAVELFVLWTAPYPNLKSELVRVIQPTFCTIFISSSPEICYLLLSFLSSLGSCVREVFNAHYKYFTLNPNDPNYLKKEKLKTFALIAQPVNVLEFISEIYPYCSDFNSYAHAIKCLGVLGLVSEKGQARVYNILPELLEGSSEKIIAAALECLLNLVTYAPSSFSLVSGNKSTANVLQDLVEPDVNQYAANSELASYSGNRSREISLPDALYDPVSKALCHPSLFTSHPALLLHASSTLCPILPCTVSCVERVQEQQAQLSPSTQCLLLTAACRVFLHRPARSYHVLCRTLHFASDSPHHSVRGHAALVRATLHAGPDQAAKLMLGK